MPRSPVRLACAALLSLAAVASAAPFEPALVGNKAKFVAFIDFDQARQTAVGKTVIDYVRQTPRYAEVEAKLLEHVGLMPLSDVHDVTLWGEQHADGTLLKEPKAVLVVRMTFNPKSLRWAAGFTPGFDVQDYHGQELMNWADENKPGHRVWACIAADDTVLFGNDADVVKRGIDVLADAKESLQLDPNAAPADADKKAAAAPPVPTDSTVWAFASAVDFAGLPDAKKNPVAGQLHDALIELGETGEKKSVVRVTGTTLTDEAGPRLERMAGGAVMLAQFAVNRAASTQADKDDKAADAKNDPKAQIAAMVPDLLRGVRVAGHGRSVTMDLAVDNATAVTLLNKMAEVHQAEVDAAGGQ